MAGWSFLLLPAVHLNPLENPALPALAPGRPAEEPGRVPPGVLLADHPVGGMPLPLLRRLLKEWARHIHLPPEPARLDAETGAAVPPLDGLALDVEANLRAAAAASSGARLPLLLKRLPAAPNPTPAPIRRGNPRRRAVALAVNVDWGEEALPALLDTLAKEGARATFFLTGRWAERHPDLARTLAARHEVASHGYAATDAIAFRREEEHVRDLELAEAAIRRATGRRPDLFSPHKGELPPALLRAAVERGYRVILWDVDTVDWRRPGPDVIVARVLAGVRAGSIILLHPTPDSTAALAALIPALRGGGYRVLTVGELLNPDPRTVSAARETGTVPAAPAAVVGTEPPGKRGPVPPGAGGRRPRNQ